MAELAKWQGFYVIIGWSGAALIGIQIVVVALVANLRPRSATESVGAFGTPTVVHFGGALLVSAILIAPRPSLVPASIALAARGLGGLAYCARVIHRYTSPDSARAGVARVAVVCADAGELLRRPRN